MKREKFKSHLREVIGDVVARPQRIDKAVKHLSETNKTYCLFSFGFGVFVSLIFAICIRLILN